MCTAERYIGKHQCCSDPATVPGRYICAQIPGGLVAGRVGGKAVMTWISYGMAAALLALPAVVRLSGVVGPAALCLGAIGVAQAPMRPAQTLMTYNWVPRGPSRAYLLR